MKKRICLAVVVGLIIACAVTMLWMQKSTTGPYTITEPYEYTLVRGSEEWLAMTDRERREAYSVPDEVVSAMTTRALLETVISNPFFSDLYVIDFESLGVELICEISIDGLAELLQREDLDRVLSNYTPDDFSQFSPLEKESGQETGALVESRLDFLRSLLRQINA